MERNLLGTVNSIESTNEFSFWMSKEARQLMFENCYVVSHDPDNREYLILAQIEGLEIVPQTLNEIAKCRVLGSYDRNGKQKPLTKPIAYGSSVYSAEPEFLERMLYSPPPSISFGKTVGNPSVKLSIALEHFQQTSTLVTGFTGSGKTKTVSLILKQFLQWNGACVVFDFFKEYDKLVSKKETKLAVPGETFFIRMDDQFIEVFSNELTDVEVDLLYRIYSEHGPRLLEKDAFEDLSARTPSTRTLKSLERKLRMPSLRRLMTTKEKLQDPIVQEHKCTIFDLSELELRHQPLFINYILRLVSSQRKKGIIPPTFIVIEEADRLLNIEIPNLIINEIISQARKTKVNVCLITQKPRFSNRDILSNCDLQIFHTTRNSSDIDALRYVAQYLTSDDVSKTSYLTKGQALISGSKIAFPTLVNVVSEF